MRDGEKAVIDRFEGKWAVLLVGAAARQLQLRRSTLPSGAREGDWLRLVFAPESSDEIIEIELDAAETELRRQRIAEKLARLRRGEHLK